MYTYTNKLGKKYILYWSEVWCRGGVKHKVYFLLRERINNQAIDYIKHTEQNLYQRQWKLKRLV